MTKGGSRVGRHMPWLAATGVRKWDRWFGSAVSRWTSEMQLPACQSIPHVQAFGVSDHFLHWKKFLGFNADASRKGPVRGVHSSFHALKGGHTLEAKASAGQVASSRDTSKQQQQQGRETGQGRDAKSRRTGLSYPVNSVGRVRKLLSDADNWKPEVEQQLGRLQLSLDTHLVQGVLVHIKHKTDVAFEYLQWAKAQGYRTTFNDYAPVISGLVRIGRFDKTQTVVEDMLQDGHTMNRNLFRILVSGFASARRPDDALEVLNQMGFFQCKPDQVIYCGVYKAIRRADIDLLAIIRREIARWGHSPSQLTVFTWLLYKGGNVDDAWTLYQEAKEKGWRLGGKTYAMLIILLGRAGRQEAALDLYKEMTTKGNTLAATGPKFAILAFHSLGLAEEAHKFLEQCEASFPSGSILISVILALASCGRVKQAIDFYSEKRTQGFRLKQLRTFNRMLEVVSKGVMSGTCEMSVLELLWRDMTERTTPDMRTCSIVINILGQGSQGDNMLLTVYEEIKHRGLVIQDSETYGTLIHRFCESGKIEVAAELWRGMVTQGLECNPNSLKSLVRSLLQEGKTSEARKVAATSKVSELSDGKLVNEDLVEGGYEVGQLEEAEEIAKEVTSPDSSICHARMYAAG